MSNINELLNIFKNYFNTQQPATPWGHIMDI